MRSGGSDSSSRKLREAATRSRGARRSETSPATAQQMATRCQSKTSASSSASSEQACVVSRITAPFLLVAAYPPAPECETPAGRLPQHAGLVARGGELRRDRLGVLVPARLQHELDARLTN